MSNRAESSRWPRSACAPSSSGTVSPARRRRARDLAAEAGEVAKEVLKGTAYGSRPFAPTSGWSDELADALFALP